MYVWVSVCMYACTEYSRLQVLHVLYHKMAGSRTNLSALPSAQLTPKVYEWHTIYQDISGAPGDASKVLMKNVQAYGLSVAIIWPWPSWLGICWKVHLGPMEGA